MKILKTIGSMTVCLLITHATSVPAQTNNLVLEHGMKEPPVRLELLTNFARSHGMTLNEALNNAEFQSNYFFELHGRTESEYLTNIVRNMNLRKPWPDASKKQEIFKHCAEVLRSAVDTNQIEIACSKLTNQPDAVLILKELSEVAKSNLNEFANLLTYPALNSYIGAGYRAEISITTNFFYFSFWPSTFVKDLEKRTLDARHVLVSARFYENGKLLEVRINTPDSKGLAFKEDGTLRNFWAKSINQWLP